MRYSGSLDWLVSRPIAHRGLHDGNQAVVVEGRHLRVQSHVEMTPALVALPVERHGALLQPGRSGRPDPGQAFRPARRLRSSG